jgi:hypothetical protein
MDANQPANQTPNALEAFFIALVRAIILLVMEGKLWRKKKPQLEAPKVAPKRRRKRRSAQLELPFE